MGMGFGVTKETWYPDLKDTGADYKLTEGLAPLAQIGRASCRERV